MKKMFFLFIYLFSSLQSFTQPDLDSLYETYNNKSLSEEARLDALNEICYNSNTSSDAISVLATDMLNMAEQKGLARYKVDAYIHQARGYIISGKFKSALDASGKATDLALEIKYPYGQTRSLALAGESYQKAGDYQLALDLDNQSLTLAKEMEILSKNRLVEGEISSYPLSRLIVDLYSNLGLVYSNMGSYVRSLEYFDKALQDNESTGSKDGIAANLHDIATIYRDQGDQEKAQEYYERSLLITEESGNKQIMAADISNIGLILMSKGDYSSALNYFNRALKLNMESGNSYQLGQGYLNFSVLYEKKGDYPSAIEYIEKAAAEFENSGTKVLMSTTTIQKGSLYHQLDRNVEAITLCKKGLTLAENIGAIDNQKNACNCLYKAYKSLNQGQQALLYHEQYKTFKDSLQTNDSGKKLQRMEFDRLLMADSLSQHEEMIRLEMANNMEIHKKDNTRNILLGTGLMFILLAGGLWNRLSVTSKSQSILQKEKDRSDSLLLNILPAEVAEELKQNGEALAKDFESVSIIFTHFVEFNEISFKMNAQELVSELNYCFRGFDDIMEKYGIEKIKTIGDAYMAAAGMHGKPDASRRAVRAALEMQQFISKRKSSQDALGLPSFEMRAGIHTGPVVAGIVGVKKFQYDIWGDTVNTASRMESNGKVGRVNISESTHQAIMTDTRFSFENRGKIEVKGKGEMEMYFVS